MNSDLISYYSSRAKEYENVYAKPERQADLLAATQMLQQLFRGEEVFEIACGTGYWTERMAKTANTIVATDINDTMLQIAKSKTYAPAKVVFQQCDIFKLPTSTQYKNLFGGFIWSHIKLDDLDSFIDTINRVVDKNGTIVFMDNKYVEGSNLPVTDRDDIGNTYQTRMLQNGTLYKVLKNFPTENFIKELLQHKAGNLDFINLKYYWMVKYRSI